MESLSPIDTFAIILSVVSLIITVLGFFASLKFYRDGVELQNKANDALTKIEERTGFIQNQVGGMFEKTLDAIIGRDVLAAPFARLLEEVDERKKAIMEQSAKQIGPAEEHELQKLADIVDGQMSIIKEKIQDAQDIVEEIASGGDDPALAATMDSIVNLLTNSRGKMTSAQMYSSVGANPSLLKRALLSLLNASMIRRDRQGDEVFYSLNR